ncbi:MAG: MogA/MoaB family molybdenum cofactor biosynthesis protein [Salinivirgaceae bacterium]|nr:MogA/MoaB family molybdenum cofactor biosynthesis protein [Salinivirgaceae bacterium]
MVVNNIYRISSHNQYAEVDDVSSSPNKVSKQILIFENEIPESDALKLFLKNNTVGTMIVVDAFAKELFNAFDSLIGCENELKILKEIKISGIRSVICLPENFLTFYIGLQIYHQPKLFTAKIVTLSDRAYRGIYEDKSGPLALEMLTAYFEKIGKKVKISSKIIPDSGEELTLILEKCKLEKTDVLITTGGTGIGSRDITVETVSKHIDKEIPGIMEMIRMKYGAQKPNALLSRGIAGTMNQTLVYTLPGSVRAVEEYLNEIFLTLDHLFYMLHGIDNH